MTTAMIRAAQFSIDGITENGVYSGFTLGQRWNGWACPLFRKAEAEKHCADYCAASDSRYQWHARYVPETDTFEYLMEPTTPGQEPDWTAEEVDRFAGFTLEDWPELGTVYAIGSHGWVWMEVDA